MKVNEISPMNVSEIVVVEGIHDKQAVLRAVTADVWVIGGDRIARTFLASLRRASEIRGVIVLTDPDGPGERIRKRIASAVPGCRHASLARQEAGNGRRIGVEFATPEAIRAALEQVRGQGERLVAAGSQFTIQDLLQARLAGVPGSAQRRERIGEILVLGRGNAKALLDKLNALAVSTTEWEAALARLQTEESGGDADDGV